MRVFELLAESNRPLHVHEIAGRLGVEDHSMNGLTAMLDDMVLGGGVRAFPGHRYKIAHDVSVVEGERGSKATRERQGFLTMNPRGFGFVASPGTGEADVFASPEGLGGALHGDTVMVRVARVSNKGPEGEIVRVVSRGVTRVPGTMRKRGKSCFLEPDDARMRGPIPIVETAAGNDGDAVVVQITRYPTQHDELPEGKVLQVLGRPGDPKVEVEKILAREDIVEPHPADVIAEARAFGDHITEKQIEGREDLRPIPLTTIDPVDARDHDDAVFVRRATEDDRMDDAAYVAWIAIADVSAYVTPGTALDAESKKRGCSVYLPDRAIPMLPRELSSHLCSLVAHQDRLCLAVEVLLDATGTPLRHRFVEGVMRNRAKLSYEDAARALGWMQDQPPSKEAMALLHDLKMAAEVSQILRARRMRRGALDFDLPEAKVKLDASGQAIDVVRSRADAGVKKAYNLIEELMLLANEVVAEELAKRSVPTVYRVHGRPDEERLDRFANLAETLGFSFHLEDANDPKALGKFLRLIATHPRAEVLNSLLLRAMKQATYDIVNIGHFGLASKAYLHFTSPIRRYPDLVVHRAVHRICQGEAIERDGQAVEALKEAALQASLSERKAMEVEREVVDLHRALLMRTHIGDEVEGAVSAVVGSGLFIALDKPYVDVLVKFEQLGSEPYEMDEEGLAAVGKRSGETIHLGDRMKVRIDDVSITRRQVYGTRIRTGAEGEAQPGERPMKRGEGRGRGGAFGGSGKTGNRRDPHGKKAAEAQAKKRAKKEERKRPGRDARKPKRRR
jgi:ribonuclease R